MQGISEFGEWFLLQPSDAGWLGPVLGRFSKGRRYWPLIGTRRGHIRFMGSQPRVQEASPSPGWLGPASSLSSQPHGVGPLILAQARSPLGR